MGPLAPLKTRQSPGRGGFDKGTLAAALIGLMRAGQKPAPSANKRTGRRPLSNPPLRLAWSVRVGGQDLGLWYQNLAINVANYAKGACEDFDRETHPCGRN